MSRTTSAKRGGRIGTWQNDGHWFEVQILPKGETITDNGLMIVIGCPNADAPGAYCRDAALAERRLDGSDNGECWVRVAEEFFAAVWLGAEPITAAGRMPLEWCETLELVGDGQYTIRLRPSETRET